jgi:iron(III) transport system permease protein
VAGFALPGLVTAFAVGLAVRGTVLYLTFPVLIAAYVLHFGGQALRAAQSAVGAVPERLGEAARLLGAPWWRRLGRVELPLMVPGLAAGGGLVLLSVLKELPITLLLRPDGMTPTLSQRIYATAEEALRVDTGLASLVLIGLSALLTWLLVIRRMEHL